MSHLESSFRASPRARRCLAVALEPLLPDRAVEALSTLTRYGYNLRLRGGERLASTHPLLGVFGARIAALTASNSRRGGFQHCAFDPGREVRLVAEPDDDGARAIGVWDAEQRLYAGRLDYESGAMVLAGEEYGIAYRAVVLDENRNTGTEMRNELRVFVYPASLVALNLARFKPYIRPPAVRRRVLLVVERDGRVGWWEDDGAAGPAALEDLTVWPSFCEAEHKLRKAARKLERVSDHGDERYPRHRRLAQAQKRFDRCAERLWLNVHRELASDHLVGYIGPHMTEPYWVPDDLSGQPQEGDYVIGC